MQRTEKARLKPAAWWAASLRRRVQLAVLGMVALLALGMAVIAWAATELAADSFINQALERRAFALRHSLSQGISLAQLAAQEPLPAYRLYSSAQPGLPAILRGMEHAGVHELSELDAHVLVIENPAAVGGRREWIYLLYLPDRDGELAAYDRAIRVHLLLMLAGAALLGLFMAWHLGRWTTAPILALNAQVRGHVQRQAQAWVLDRPDEIGELSRSFALAYRQLADYARRERDFTRFASHELRTPLSVIQGAAELIRLAPSRERMQAPLQRIQRAGAQMHDLIELFLLLARDQQAPDEERESVLQCLRACLQELQSCEPAAALELRWPAEGAPDWQALERVQLPRALGRLALGNLLRNARLHGQGWLSIGLRDGRLSLGNSRPAEPDAGRATSSHGHGHGHGLDIVDAICERLGWQFETLVAPGSYRVELQFAVNPQGPMSPGRAVPRL